MHPHLFETTAEIQKTGSSANELQTLMEATEKEIQQYKEFVPQLEEKNALMHSEQEKY